MVGPFFFFFWSVSHLFKNQNIYYIKNFLSKPLKVIVYIRIASKSAFERLTHKDAACRTEAFLHTSFLENEAQTDQKITEQCFSCQNKNGLPKISSILQKVTIGPKAKNTPITISYPMSASGIIVLFKNTPPPPPKKKKKKI